MLKEITMKIFLCNGNWMHSCVIYGTQYSSIESHNMVLAFRCTYVILQSVVKMVHFVINNMLMKVIFMKFSNY